MSQMQFDLSIIIVNYNVQHFLDQCLSSVNRAKKNLNIEVLVVDNNSIDNSIEMLETKFPWVVLIQNKKNVGFSKANNQAIKTSNGRYVLLLNPDTVLEENTLVDVFSFMEKTPDAGGLGVKMIDGKGRFLPESKRGLPTPWVAFYKIFGLSKLCPKSPKYNRYHLGYLPEDQTNEIEVLSGAFMMMRRGVLDEVGLLDESFFMYGEDIDLSYRIVLGGYKNYYYPHTQIIHYKGESTKKSSVNYVFVFYRAMVIFAKKHFSSNYASIIYFAIYLRVFAALFHRFIKRYIPFIIDWAVSSVLLYQLTFFYGQIKGIDYEDKTLFYLIPFYVLMTVCTMAWFGWYDSKSFKGQPYKGFVWSSILLMVFYAMLPLEYRFSRLVVLFGSGFIFGQMALFKWVLSLLFNPSQNKTNIAIVGSLAEINRIKNVLSSIKQLKKVKKIDVASYTKDVNFDIGLHQLDELIAIEKINELIFCAKDCSSQMILQALSNLSFSNLSIKIAHPEDFCLIGDKSIETKESFYLSQFNHIYLPLNKRKKRAFDILTSLFLLLGFPFFVWLKKYTLRQIFDVLFNRKTWVGYSSKTREGLPKIKPWVFHILFFNHQQTSSKNINMMYARHYNLMYDFKTLMAHLIK